MEISQQAFEPDMMVLALKGRLDARTSPKLKAILRDLLTSGPARIVIDLQDVSFIDSSGLVALVSGLRLAQENKGTIVLSGTQPQAQIVFRLTMLDRVFTIYPTLDKAKTSLNDSSDS